jgi:TetR/AcrR family transcriptional repressor of nem operon
MRKSQKVTAITRTSILKAAAASIRKVGFEATTVSAVMSAAGLTHGGFYRHFPSLASLHEESYRVAVKSGSSWARTRAAALGKKGRSPLDAFVESYLARERLTKPENRCAVASIASEVPRQALGIQLVAQTEVRAIVAEIAARLPGDAAPATAVAVTAQLVGAAQLARILNGGPDAESVLEAVRKDLLTRFA